VLFTVINYFYPNKENFNTLDEQCAEDEFNCGTDNGGCILNSSINDEEDDCFDGLDEPTHRHYPCELHQQACFSPSGNICIDKINGVPISQCPTQVPTQIVQQSQSNQKFNYDQNFETDYGDCNSYCAPDGSNRDYCNDEGKGDYQGTTAQQECPQCNQRTNLNYHELCTNAYSEFESTYGTCDTYCNQNSEYCEMDTGLGKFSNKTTQEACEECYNSEICNNNNIQKSKNTSPPLHKFINEDGNALQYDLSTELNHLILKKGMQDNLLRKVLRYYNENKAPKESLDIALSIVDETEEEIKNYRKNFLKEQNSHTHYIQTNDGETHMIEHQHPVYLMNHAFSDINPELDGLHFDENDHSKYMMSEYKHMHKFINEDGSEQNYVHTHWNPFQAHLVDES
jgi:hypothetical protein